MLLGVAVHEIGHALGIKHATDINAIMYPQYTGQTTLGADDINAIINLYGGALLSAPTAVCPNQNFTVSLNNEVPSGYSVSWGCSSNLTQTSTSGSQAIFKANSGMDGWVSVRINGAEVRRCTVSIGTPLDTDITGHCSIYNSNTRTYRATAFCTKADEFEWMTMSPGWTITAAQNSSTQMMNDVLITPNSPSAPSTTLAVRAYNSCGWSDWIVIDRISYNMASYSVIIAPNPVSSTLNVILKQEENGLVENANVSPPKTGADPIYVLRLFNNMGVLVLQTTTQAVNTKVQFDVSALANGTYFLQVVNKDGREQQTATVIVRH